MASNFDFLEEINPNLFSVIEDAQKLFRDGYFNQAVVQIRIFAEKMAKEILGGNDSLTFDDTLNCLKDRVKSEREREFIEDLFFIKKEGNKCAHGEDTTAMTVLEVIKRAFEASINYAYALKHDENIDKLRFDETLLITTKPRSENSIVDKYVELAQEESQKLEQEKEKEQKEAKRNEKEQKRKAVKEKVKKAKKFLKLNVNENTKKPIKKVSITPYTNVKQKENSIEKKTKTSKKQKNKKHSSLIKPLSFIIFVLISIFLIAKMIFFF